MSKRFISKFIFIILALTFTLSCKKYLDKKPDNILVVPKTLVDFQALLDNPGNMNFMTTTDGESGTDDYFVLETTYNNDFPPRYKDLYDWRQPQDIIYPNDWSFCYSPVYYSNLVLEGIEKVTLTPVNEASWKNVKGSALFFRAFAYLNVAWQYANAFDESTSATDMGIVIRLGSDFNVPSTRATVKESYDQIINDAMEAAALLRPLPEKVFRPSKAAAYALLARTYLSMRIYDSAFKYSDLSLQLKPALIDYNNGVVPGDIRAPFKNFRYDNNPETIFYAMANSAAYNYVPVRGAMVDTILYATFGVDDIRRRAFFRASGSYFLFKGSYAASMNSLFSGLTTAEMYLLRAECLARGVNGQAGDKDLALADLNHLLTNRWVTGSFIPVAAADANEALDQVLLERRKELLFRGVRWIDIKRLNKEGRNITLTRILPNGESKTLEPNANFYAYPLPKDIITLSGIQQNP